MMDRFKIGHDMPTNTPPSIEGKCINVTFIKETPPPPFNFSIHCEHIGLLVYFDSLHVRDQYMVSSIIGEADNVTA